MDIVLFILGIAAFVFVLSLCVDFLTDLGDWLRRSWRRFFGAAAALAFLGALPGPAAAQATACAPREVVYERLAERYGETRKAVGLATGSVIEVWASEETGTWTILRVTPQGVACLQWSGQAYQPVTALRPEGDPL